MVEIKEALEILQEAEGIEQRIMELRQELGEAEKELDGLWIRLMAGT